jgi:predicted LPLAT superfamily acyltransferase
MPHKEPEVAAAWMQQRERSNLAALRFIAWVAQRMGRPAARLLLPPIALYFVLAATTARRASRDYLRRVHGREPSLRELYRHVWCFAATILDRFFLLNDRFDLFDIRVHGQDVLDEACSDGRGIFMIGAHLGSFEAIRSTNQGEDVEAKTVSMVMYEDNARTLNEVLGAINPDLQPNIIPLGTIDAMLRVKHALEEGHLVGMLCDRTLSSDSVCRVDMLGSPVDLPSGPFRMAAMLKRPVVLMVGLYRGGNRYDVHFERLADFTRPRPSQPTELQPCPPSTVDEVVARYAERLCHHARSAPENWFNFYDYWNERGAAPSSS